LLRQVESEIQARGGRLLLVETSATATYALARHLYEVSGYQREAVIHNFYAPGDDLVVYAKDMEADQGGEGEEWICEGGLADTSMGASIAAGD
jgi:ribosomal protein S18 acetylase RimI-like enzyme